MIQKLIYLIALILLSIPVYSQEYTDIKNQRIDLEKMFEENTFSSNINPFISNVYSFIGSDFDSLDLELLLHGPILTSLIIGNITENDSLTYGYLYQKSLEFKQIPVYVELRNKLIIAKDIMKRPADIKNWENDKSLLMEIGLEGSLLENLHSYIKDNGSSFLSYETIFVGFREQMEQQRIKERETNQQEIDYKMETSILFIETEVLSQCKTQNKPILLYFTGYANVNCRKIEHAVFNDPKIFEVLSQNFIFTPIYVDDRNELTSKEQVEVNFSGRTKKLKTIGDKHLYYQISRFNVSSQPYFVVLNCENEIIGITDYSSNSVNKFLKFLNDSLKKHEN